MIDLFNSEAFKGKFVCSNSSKLIYQSLKASAGQDNNTWISSWTDAGSHIYATICGKSGWEQGQIKAKSVQNHGQASTSVSIGGVTVNTAFVWSGHRSPGHQQKQ